ncbi:hypothetical protein R1flu_025510 [Riccia fluitans]|uniref:Uncharacterized protein n=1 Tax=Riccia fluitans TaxID=41844 RepID=A0ABD1XYU4_9MARC
MRITRITIARRAVRSLIDSPPNPVKRLAVCHFSTPFYPIPESFERFSFTIAITTTGAIVTHNLDVHTNATTIESTTSERANATVQAVAATWRIRHYHRSLVTSPPPPKEKASVQGEFWDEEDTTTAWPRRPAVRRPDPDAEKLGGCVARATKNGPECQGGSASAGVCRLCHVCRMGAVGAGCRRASGIRLVRRVPDPGHGRRMVRGTPGKSADL